MECGIRYMLHAAPGPQTPHHHCPAVLCTSYPSSKSSTHLFALSFRPFVYFFIFCLFFLFFVHACPRGADRYLQGCLLRCGRRPRPSHPDGVVSCCLHISVVDCFFRCFLFPLELFFLCAVARDQKLLQCCQINLPRFPTEHQTLYLHLLVLANNSF